MRDASDDAAHLRYTRLAAAYARVVASLPAPPDGAPLHVHVGNEFNACNEWRCSDDAPNATLSIAARMREVAGFYSDVERAIAPVLLRRPHLRYAHGPIANWQHAACACPSGDPLGAGAVGLTFLRGMLRAVPDLYRRPSLRWFSSHSYPFSLAPWGSPKSYRGLTYFRNETALVAANSTAPKLPVIVTETGWRRDATQTPPIGDVDVSNWTARAFDRIWLQDAQVLGVTPFLLEGKFWDKTGWPWVTDSVPRLVFNTTRALRCTVVGGADCD